MAGFTTVPRLRTNALLLLAAVVLTAGAAAAQEDGETAEEVFSSHVSGRIIQEKCVKCHVAGGPSGNTRLVFVRSSDAADHEARNLRALQNLLDDLRDEGGGAYILNKIQGVSHGGGPQVPAGTPEFDNMARFLGLLGAEIATAALTPETLFDTVVLASNSKTLRRAALIFAGRIPTDEEYAAVEGGDERALRATIRGFMEGPQFHEFLIRGSNDRLLTDRKDGNIIRDTSFVDYTNERYRLREAAQASGDHRELEYWEDRVQYGARRAPLELIAYVVENDLPYTEILTADYIMANPWAAAAYGASTWFNDPDDVHEFKPSRISSYYRKGDGFIYEYDPVLGHHVLDPGPLITDYPHAGILNTTSFLLRYPTTATNRNRARARWTYYHFLALDVEKSASRTTDPVALEDTNNPTMHNPACTVCHSVLDPVAGAFQNYSDDGSYRINRGGLDSLDGFYKEATGLSLGVQAESWAERESLSWSLSLAAGVQTLRVMYPNHFWDEAADEGGRGVYLDRLRVTDGHGNVIGSHEFEDLEAPVAHWGRCGDVQHNQATGRDDHFHLWGGYRECAFFIDVEVPSGRVYDVEIVAWSNGWDERYYGEDGFAALSVAANAYEEGDTWYRDMRTPGFDGERAPDPDNSLQWLAQRVVADERFAEASVAFWWPAIMGSEIAEFPVDAADADFEGRLLAASAQDEEVVRLADGFRDGFPGSSYTYNLRDLLVEIVLSKWFRADALMDADPVRRVALRDAGARRLLTPEELARKTAALTGFQWGRHIRTNCWPRCERLPNALTNKFRLLYGGIDSDGITERARDVTSVMAGVAKRHAAQVSCPIVMREFYLLPGAERRLFAGVVASRELGGGFEIKANSGASPQTVSLNGALTAGAKTVRFTYRNPRPGRVIRLDRLDVRDAAGQVVASHEIEDVEWSGGSCDGPGDDHFFLGCSSSVDVAINDLAAANYTIEIVAWADHAGDELPRLTVTVLNTEGIDSGEDAIRRKLVELHGKLLGVQLTRDSPDVEAAYQLFVEVREHKRALNDDRFQYWRCRFYDDHFFFDGVLDDTVDAVVEKENERGHRYYGFDWDRVGQFLDLDDIDFSDPDYAAQTWIVVLATMLMDYRYLYL